MLSSCFVWICIQFLDCAGCHNQAVNYGAPQMDVAPWWCYIIHLKCMDRMGWMNLRAWKYRAPYDVDKRWNKCLLCRLYKQYNTSGRFTLVGGQWLLSWCWLHYLCLKACSALPRVHLCVKVSLKTWWFSQGPPPFWDCGWSVHSCILSTPTYTVNHGKVMIDFEADRNRWKQCILLTQWKLQTGRNNAVKVIF